MKMSNRHRRLANAEIETALCKHDGVVSRAALELGVSRQAIYYRLSVSPHLCAKANDERDEFLDYCREAILQGIKARHMPTLRWYAEHFMRDRGYGRYPIRWSDLVEAELEKTILSQRSDLKKFRTAEQPRGIVR